MLINLLFHYLFLKINFNIILYQLKYGGIITTRRYGFRLRINDRVQNT